MLFDKDGTLCRSDGFLSALAQARALCCAELTGEPSITEPLLMAYGPVSYTHLTLPTTPYV